MEATSHLTWLSSNLPPARFAAAWNVQKHLDKLELDGVVKRRDWLWIPLPIMGIRLDRLLFQRWYLR